jgi:tRNA nucleotidyltransferase (CCA-adding enzyme)
LRLPKKLTQTIREVNSLKDKLNILTDPKLSPSGIYSLLYEYSPLALSVGTITNDSPVAQDHINRFLNELRYVKPVLTGKDLLKLGYPSGPRINEMLYRLHMAILDGKVTSKQDEEKLIRERYPLN